MTNFQKAFCVFLSLCFVTVLVFLPEPFFLRGNFYRQIPLYDFLEKEAWSDAVETDEETSELIMEKNAAYLAEKVQAENSADKKEEEAPAETQEPSITPPQEEKLSPEPTKAPSAAPSPSPVPSERPLPSPTPEETKETAVQPHPVVDLSPEALADPDYFKGEFFIEDKNVSIKEGLLDAARFLEKDMTLKQDTSAPQILIYHSHSQEAFIDSREGKVEDTIVGVGDYLKSILKEKYGYHVVHVKEEFDMAGGVEDRSLAYDYARDYLEPFLEENPSIEVIIDLHRDGVSENRHLVTEVNGKPTAQIMFFNGVSRTVSQGDVSYLPNPYIEDNLAFSFQLEYQSALYYPDFYRGIYLAGLRYNLHLRPKSILLEAGAQTNTVQEVKNAMEPFADILDRVLKGQ